MSQHIYFLGIGGTLMGSLAQLAKSQGFKVSGSDSTLYPPMSDLLSDAKIQVFDHFDPRQLAPTPDQIVIGNAGQHRGNPAIEYILDNGLNYVSGAEWLGTNVLRDRWVMAISGTHGKTTTASMLSWIFAANNKDPGFLIGGSPNNFSRSAQIGSDPFFIVEADEYDTSFFDRRSKFIHYRPKTLVINNMEYDHADIFPSIEAIQDQFHLLIRSIPGNGLIITPEDDQNIQDLLEAGCWAPVQYISTQQKTPRLQSVSSNPYWLSKGDGSEFEVYEKGKLAGEVQWSLMGEHNRLNAMSAIAAANHAGISADKACSALCSFEGVKRRLEVIYRSDKINIYDDFAHHPSAIQTTLDAIRSNSPSDRIIAVIEPRTHTMSLGALQSDLVSCNRSADQTYWFKGDNIKWDLEHIAQNTVTPSTVFADLEQLIEQLHRESDNSQQTHMVIMSNGAFGGIYGKLIDRLPK
jgi:UDP-N-acetylmuramate: L-alanyl-gamma-D-glutamyl-meso-diaminopimelate ligase